MIVTRKKVINNKEVKKMNYLVYATNDNWYNIDYCNIERLVFYIEAFETIEEAENRKAEVKKNKYQAAIYGYGFLIYTMTRVLFGDSFRTWRKGSKAHYNDIIRAQKRRKAKFIMNEKAKKIFFNRMINDICKVL